MPCLAALTASASTTRTVLLFQTAACVAPQRPASELAREHLYLACAMIRGALCHLGVDCIVSADAAALPACDFTIVTKAQTA